MGQNDVGEPCIKTIDSDSGSLCAARLLKSMPNSALVGFIELTSNSRIRAVSCRTNAITFFGSAETTSEYFNVVVPFTFAAFIALGLLFVLSTLCVVGGIAHAIFKRCRKCKCCCRGGGGVKKNKKPSAPPDVTPEAEKPREVIKFGDVGGALSSFRSGQGQDQGGGVGVETKVVEAAHEAEEAHV